MGVFQSKKSAKQKGVEDDAPEKINFQNIKQEETFKIVDPNLLDQKTIEQMKSEFKEETEIFILNQLLMSFMFFDCYQRDIGKCASSLPDRQKEVSNNLIQHHQKELLLPDTILKHVCQKVKLEETEDPTKRLLQPLVTQRMYILHTNIEIDDKKYLINYSRIDKNVYGAEIEESKCNKGFVKLNLVRTPRSSKQKRNSIDSSYSELLEAYESKLEKDIINVNIPSTSKGNKANDSGFNTESEYGYTTITASKTPQSIDVSETNTYNNNITRLPKECITEVQIKNINGFNSDSDESDSVDLSEKRQLKELPLFIQSYYLNSTEFMEHFKSNIFPNYLGEILEFPPNFMEQTKSVYGALYCNSTDNDNNKIEYVILPAIPIGWPHEIAVEWSFRPRNKVVEEKENGTFYYIWPTENMVNEAKKLSCVLIPKGFMPKRSSNPEMHIEWEIDFPKTERYLELRMSHAQTRCYLFILILFRKLIKPKTQTHGILVEHIRHLMFWECESNYREWPEHRLGNKMLLVLKNLLNYLAKRCLPNYFIKAKNLLLNVPNKHIITTMEILQDILHTPVLNFISVLKHLRYTDDKFYPAPDLHELQKIITSKNVYDQNVQNTMVSTEEDIKNKYKERYNEGQRKNKRDKEFEWNRRYMAVRRQRNIQNLVKDKDDSITEKNLTQESDEVSVQERFRNDIVRQIRLLEFFIKIFIQISKRSYKISSTSQTELYLKQTWYLTKLLEDINKLSAIEYQKDIKKVEEKCQKKKAMEPNNPDVPKRNTFTGVKKLEVKGKEINITNLSKSYNDPTRYKTKKKCPLKEELRQECIKVDIHNERNTSETDHSSREVSKPSSSHEKSNLQTASVSSFPMKTISLEISHNDIVEESTDL